MARRWSSADTGTSTGQPASPCQPGRRTVEGSVPWASINDVIVSGPTHVIRAGHTSTAEVSTTSARASSAPRSICPAGPDSSGAGEP